MLDRAHAPLALIDRGGRKGTCHYALNFETGEFPTFSVLRRGSELLSLRTLHLALSGQREQAAASLVSALHWLRVLESEPVVVSTLVRLLQWSLACRDLSAVLGHQLLHQASMQSLDQALAAAEGHDLVRRTLLGERVFALGALTEELGPDWRDEPSPWQVPSWTRRRGQRAATEYLIRMAETVRIAGEPWPHILERMPAEIPRPALDSDDRGSFATPLMQPTSHLVAATRAGRAAIAVERYRKRYGRMPTSLAEVSSDGEPLPPDPFTGEALRYQRTTSGYTIDSMPPTPLAEGEECCWRPGLHICLDRRRVSETGSGPARATPF